MKLLLKSGLIFFVILMLFPASSVISQNGKQSSGQKWFWIKPVANNVWRIDDHGGGNIYLVIGNEKALLIDTGNGVADLAGTVKTLTDLPLMVVNTHGHPDHAGGNFQFSKVYANPLDAEITKHFTSEEFHNSTIERTIQANPEMDSLFIKDITGYGTPEYIPIQDGYIFDLGNRKLEVIETPGHTKGSIVLLDATNRLLFSGDNNNLTVWLFLEDCLPLETYLQTLINLDKRCDAFDYLLPGHGDVIDNLFIGEQIVCVKNIISGECKGETYQNYIRPALSCSYKRAKVAFDPNNIFVKK